MSPKTTLIIGNKPLTSAQIAEAALNPMIKVALTVETRQKVQASRDVVEQALASNKVVYGVTTGFGSFKDKVIDKSQIAELQENLIRSHSTGVGELLADEVVRAALIIRLSSLVHGHSGVRLELVDLLVGMINQNVIPLVPSQGSVGSSGDLAPLSHMGLVLMGEGLAHYRGETLKGGVALKKAGLKSIRFMAKEGLAFNNGTAVMTGIAAIALTWAERLIELADLSTALTLEAVRGSSLAFDPRIHSIRPHPGQILSASNIARYIKGSKLINSVPNRVQDGYSIRCAPQVHGAARDAVTYVSGVVNREINAVTDNPLVFPKQGDIISGGNFHGEPIAIAMDVLAIALSEIANISERRTSRLMDPVTSDGLPMFLIESKYAGLHSGLMISQYTAAALVSENKVLAHPASVDSIPTSANQEDHVSMGTIAARKALNIIENVDNVLAIEVMSACQAINYRPISKLAPKTREVFKLVRSKVPYLVKDRVLSNDIAAVKEVLTGLKSTGL